MALAMLNNDSTDGDGNEAQITVLVTGFGPFQDLFPVNPSYEITKGLPRLLPKTTDGSKSVRIIGLASPIRVAYSESRKLVPALLDSYDGAINIVLHIGMASGRKFYAAEHYAHREGYSAHKDLDGEVPSPDEADTVYGDCPSLMSTSLDFDELMKLWKTNISKLPDESVGAGADCRLSEDAGNFLCDYTYFNSLAWFGRRNKRMEGGKASDRPVMFLHVPAEVERIPQGKEVAIALIRALVDCYTKVEGPAEM
ncbi:Hypothetical protein R9X50_00332100 [Acrodontium crateriforme]|uniref:Peptidase C15, pyroglutamyl peptidase I-like protein n=1 Tax=Acrodontium crateriforme TaxID=150365 RepID=A0AAQ3M2B2_9PEZI|nr:Hypothetical protein R9X50_00332100 [Acrodontium crateriforme]